MIPTSASPSSLVDYIFRRLAIDYLSAEERAELNILSVGERTQPTLPGVEETVIETVQGHDIPSDPPSIESALTLLDLAEEHTGVAPPRHRCPPRSKRMCPMPTRRTACSAGCRCNAPARAMPARVAGAPAAAADQEDSLRPGAGRLGRCRPCPGSASRLRSGETVSAGSKSSAESVSPRKGCCTGSSVCWRCRWPRGATTRLTSGAPSKQWPINGSADFCC